MLPSHPLFAQAGLNPFSFRAAVRTRGRRAGARLRVLIPSLSGLRFEPGEKGGRTLSES